MTEETAQEFMASRPDRPPTHPGAILREDVLPALRLPIVTVARQLGVTRQHLHRLLAEQSGVSSEMAIRLGKYCGNGPMLWMRLQEAYDLWHASRKLGSAIEAIPTMRASEAA